MCPSVVPVRRSDSIAQRSASPPGSPWENGYVEPFNARLRDELLNSEIFYSLKEPQIIIESWRQHYNTVRPHASLGYKAATRGVRSRPHRAAASA